MREVKLHVEYHGEPGYPVQARFVASLAGVGRSTSQTSWADALDGLERLVNAELSLENQ